MGYYYSEGTGEHLDKRVDYCVGTVNHCDRTMGHCVGRECIFVIGQGTIILGVKHLIGYESL